MWTYNCARVYVGDYSYSKTHTYPETAPGGTYESCELTSCGYKVLKGSVIAKQLRPIKIRATFGEPPSPIGYHALQAFSIYPSTDTAIIRIFNSKGSHLVKLMKHQQGSRSTIFKAGL